MNSCSNYQFNHLHIYCTDLDQTERWFTENFGAQVVARRDARGVPLTMLELGGARFQLRPERPGENLEPAPARPFGLHHFGLTVADLDATAADLKRRGVVFEVEPYLFHDTLRIAYVLGPDNVRIELMQYLDR